jgi:GGDEF domain-containing protein
VPDGRVPLFPRSILDAAALLAGGVAAAVAAPRLARRFDRPDPRADAGSNDAGRAHRRAAVELHHRSMTAALDLLVDRDLLEQELRDGDGPRSVVAVTLHRLEAASAPWDPAAHDELIDQAIRRIRSIVREPTGVHRVGDTDLIAVIRGDRYVADTVARRVDAAFTDPFSIGGADLAVEVGIGVAEVDLADPAGAVHQADLAAQRSSIR